jgi:hypothetical protein
LIVSVQVSLILLKITEQDFHPVVRRYELVVFAGPLAPQKQPILLTSTEEILKPHWHKLQRRAMLLWKEFIEGDRLPQLEIYRID